MAQGKSSGRVHIIRSGDIDACEIRERLNMTRTAFSEAFGISVPTLKKWEARTRVPEGPAKAYLMVIDKNLAAVKRALQSV